MNNRSGKRFTNTTIQSILRRETYVGILKCGESQSGVIPEIQIVPQELFDRAQENVDRCQRELENSKTLLDRIRIQYETLETWSAVFSDSAIEVKKMIVAQIISAVRVSRGYNIDIDFNISFEQFGVEV